MNILHIAPQNFAGVPYDFFRMHNACGDVSRLVTLHKNALDFPEDICLDFPLPTTSWAKKWRRKKLTARETEAPTEAPTFIPKNLLEKLYFTLGDNIRRRAVESAIDRYRLFEADIIHYDGGLDFYRYPTQALAWKKEGKRIVCCYYGSDLRARGLIRELDAIADLNLTSEFDHLSLKKNLHYLFYPYDMNEVPPKSNAEHEKVRIVHSPTNRKFKGTDVIVSVIERIQREKAIEFLLVENTPRPKLLEIKATCDICIDQVGGTMGGTGYGKAGLETLAMGIPTITNMTADYADWLPNNPFVVANNADELYRVLTELVESAELRHEKGEAGKRWVAEVHGYENVNRKLYELYKMAGIV